MFLQVMQKIGESLRKNNWIIKGKTRNNYY